MGLERLLLAMATERQTRGNTSYFTDVQVSLGTRQTSHQTYAEPGQQYWYTNVPLYTSTSQWTKSFLRMTDVWCNTEWQTNSATFINNGRLTWGVPPGRTTAQWYWTDIDGTGRYITEGVWMTKAFTSRYKISRYTHYNTRWNTIRRYTRQQTYTYYAGGHYNTTYNTNLGYRISRRSTQKETMWETEE